MVSAGRNLPISSVIEEKISLSERFGLWVSFYPFSQDEYLAIVSLVSDAGWRS